MNADIYKNTYDDGTIDYCGYISLTEAEAVCSDSAEQLVQEACACVQIGDEIYYRCGTMKRGKGTKVTGARFNEMWWKKFGNKMLKLEQVRELKEQHDNGPRNKRA